jgi:hemerythrin-like domain-containing protein
MKEDRIQDALRDDHRRLDALGERLLNPVHVNDAAAADAAYGDFERGVLAHLDVEEQHLLPLVERDHAAEAAAIRAEHEKIRALLAEIGVSLELHAVREERMEALAAFLKAHAEREEGLLYRLADDALDHRRRASILERLHLARAHRDAA